MELIFFGNELTKLPYIPKCVTILDLSKNKLTKVKLHEFFNLSELYLSSNKITKVELSNLPNLRELKLVFNKLTEFKLYGLHNLLNLNINNNEQFMEA